MTQSPMLPRDPAVRAVTDALARPFDPREVKFKPQMVKNNRALAAAYIDARLIQDRLDEVLGVENWQDAYKILPDGSVMCRLRLKLGDHWVTKTDVGSPSEQPDVGDRLKAAFSDALKRAAVKFGIGRYLYRLPVSWVDYDPVKKQIVQPPQLPAFALPAARREGDKGRPGEGEKGRRGEGEKAAPIPHAPTPAPKTEPVKPVAAETPATAVDATKAAPNLPANGQELHRRLREYDAKLAEKKACALGALLSHVTQAGIKAGYSANMTDWAGPAIQFAVDAVKAFDHALRTTKGEPRNAA